MTGAHTGWLVADSGNAITETNEDNNTAFTALDVLPDLALDAEDITGEGPLDIAIHNTGFITATDVLVTVRQDAFIGTLLYSGTLAAIEPDGTASLAAIVPTGYYTLFVEADPLYTIAEMDESNNLVVQEIKISQRVCLPLVLRQ